MAVTATAVLCASVLTGAESALGAPNALAPMAVIPPIPAQDDSGTKVIGRNTIARAKTSITIPLSQLRLDANLHLTPDNNYLISDVKGWVVSPTGSAQAYGLFPTIHAQVLAFGGIPVTATVQLSQILTKGLLEPITIYGRSENFPPFKVDPVIAKGRVNLRLSNVMVDQVPLDVGPDCHTTAPVTLSLIGLAPKYGVTTGGPLNGNAAIPAFAGCHSGTEDLDALLTGMISGPTNPLAMEQGRLGLWNSTTNSCPDCDPPPPLP